MSVRGLVLTLVLSAALAQGHGSAARGEIPAAGQTATSVCPPMTLPAEGYVYQRHGQGRGPSQAAAEIAAEEDARESLLRDFGQMMTDAERATLRGRIERRDVLTRQTGESFSACALVWAQPQGVPAALEVEVAKLRAGLKAASGGLLAPGKVDWSSVSFLDPAWEDGSSARLVGARTQAFLRGELAQLLPGFKTSDDPARARTEVRLQMTQLGGVCGVQLQYRPRKSASWQYTAVVPFHPLALSLSTCEPPPESALSDARMGLVQGERPGSGGLTVRLWAPRTEVCNGDRFPLRVEASAPAWVRIYALGADGRLALGWRTPGPVTHWQTPVEAESIVYATSGEERHRLVAVAVPAKLGEDGFGFDASPPEDPAAGCMWGPGTGWPKALLPAEAAVHAVEQAVFARGRDSRCAADPQADALAEQLRAAITHLPACPPSRLSGQ